jgi:hypothetical protein
VIKSRGKLELYYIIAITITGGEMSSTIGHCEDLGVKK